MDSDYLISLQARFKVRFKIAQNPSKMLQIARERAWEYKYTPKPKTFTEWLYGVSTESTIFRAYLILEKYQRFLTLLHTLSVFLYSYTSKRDVLVLVSFLWGGGFSMFGFIIAHAKNSHVFLRVY